MRRLLVAAFVLLVALPGATAGAYDLNDDLADINRRIDSITGEIAAANASRTGVVTDIVITRDDLALRQAELAATEDDLAATRDDRPFSERHIDEREDTAPSAHRSSGSPVKPG